MLHVCPYVYNYCVCMYFLAMYSAMRIPLVPNWAI